MKTETITIANLKCGGCETSIKNALGKLNGVQSVQVDFETDSVQIQVENSTSRQALTEVLHGLGYPEATEENGLLLKLKSYASCMVGRMAAS